MRLESTSCNTKSVETDCYALLVLYPCTPKSSPTFSGVKLLKEFKVQYAEYERQRQELTNAEMLFDLPIILYPNLVEVDPDLKNITKVYELYDHEAQRVSAKPSLVSVQVSLFHYRQ